MIFLFLTDFAIHPPLLLYVHYCMSTAQPPPEVSTSISSLHLHLASTSLLDFSFSFFSRLFSFHSPYSIPCCPVPVGHTLLQPSWILLCLDSSSGSPVLPVSAVDALLSSFFPHFLSSPFPLSFPIPFTFSSVVLSAWEPSWWLRLSYLLTPCEFFSSCDHTAHSLVALLGGLAYQKDHQLESSG